MIQKQFLMNAMAALSLVLRIVISVYLLFMIFGYVKNPISESMNNFVSNLFPIELRPQPFFDRSLAFFGTLLTFAMLVVVNITFSWIYRYFSHGGLKPMMQAISKDCSKSKE